VRLTSAPGHITPIGAKVTIHNSKGQRKKRIVTGDSFYAQTTTSVHFGLGAENRVERIVVDWPNGPRQEIDSPAVNQYHDVAAGAQQSSAGRTTGTDRQEDEGQKNEGTFP
jgi:hypothetical protein